MSREELAAENVTDLRWWSLSELERSDATFAPRDLPRLMRSLIDEGPPAEPIEVGV